MRKFVLVLLLAVSVSAQTPDKTTRVSLFLTNPGFQGNEFLDAGVGVALEHHFTPRWSVELEAAREVHDYQRSIFNPTVIEFNTYPIDVFGRYSFQSTHEAWRPFLGIGARYINAPDEPEGADYDTQMSPEIGAGIEWKATDSLSLVFDAKAITRTDAPHWDELLKIQASIGWRF
jgi:outer membrane protein W